MDEVDKELLSIMEIDKVYVNGEDVTEKMKELDITSWQFTARAEAVLGINKITGEWVHMVLTFKHEETPEG